MFAQTLGIGLMVGAVFAVGAEAWVLGAVLFGVGLVVELAWATTVSVWNRRADRTLRAEVARGSEELVGGDLVGIEATGRVVRRRIARSAPAFVRSSPSALLPPAIMLVVTVLTESGAHRRAALVPGDVGLAARRAPVLVVLHPTREEVAVLDTAPDAAALAAIEADPRWRSAQLPTDRRVAGGYLPLVGLALLGLLVGLAVDAGLVALIA